MKQTINKILSVALSVILLISVCFCALTITAANKEITYYVKAAGSDTASGLVESEPLKTIGTAVQKAIDGGYSTEDTVYVNLIDFADISWGTNCEYDFNLVIRANSDAMRNNVYIPNNFVFGGNTAFESVIVKYTTSVYYGNNSVSFDDNCTFVAKNHYIGNSTAIENENVTNAQNLYFGSTVVSEIFRLSDKVAKNKTYKEDVSVVFSDENSTPHIYLAAESGATVFEKDLSINIMSAKSVDFLAEDGTVSVGGALQFIVNSETKVSQESLDALEGLSPAKGYYYIVNASGVDNLINTTETAGRYLVNTDRYRVIATDENGVSTEAQDGVLTLENAGRYVIKTVKIIETATYYVKPSGSDENDGLSSSEALATVARAVELANAAGYLEGDLITVKVMRNSILDTTAVSMGTLPRYYFDMLVQSSSSLYNTQIQLSSNIANNQGGTTQYKKVELVKSAQWSAIHLNGSNVIFDSTVKFNFGFGTAICYGSGNDGGAGKKIDGQAVSINCVAPYSVSLSNGSWSGRTYTDDVNLTINNSSSNLFVQFNAYHLGTRSGTTYYKKNVNINLKSASGFRLSQLDGAFFEGAIQIINSAGLDFDAVYSYAGASSTPPTINEALQNVEAPKYLIYNETGITDVMSFSETAGKFIVDTDKYKLSAIHSNGSEVTSSDGYLTLEETGVYTVSLTHTHEYTNDCDETCDICGDVRLNAHVYENECDAECNTCGYVRTNNHVYDNSCDTVCNVCFQTREISHTYKSVCDSECDVCGFIREAQPHTYSYSCDTVCNLCDFERVAYHEYTNGCDAFCNVCGEERIPDDHVYSHDCDALCNICLAERTIEHQFSNECDATCNVCGFVRSAAHSYSNICDAECNVCKFTRSDIHEFDNICDSVCNLCGAVRDNSHVYDNACDKECNLCNAVRAVPEHIFDSECDATCAECGFEREVEHLYYGGYIANETNHWKQCRKCGLVTNSAEHSFDNDCDNKCDICNYIRVTEGHKYDNACDNTCGSCGFIRYVEGHQYDNICDETCNTCGSVREIAHKYSSDCDTECNICGFIRQDIKHTGGTATCKLKAVCEVCGQEYGKTDSTNHTGRMVYRVPRVEPTCTEDGYSGDIYCLDCNKLAVAGSVIPAINHQYSSDCDESCDLCGNSRTAPHYYSPLTCTESQKCYICGAQGETATGHTYVEKVEKATFTQNGRKYQQCSGCGIKGESTTINRILSVKLSETEFEYDGNEKKPLVEVKDSSGKIISSEYYTVTYPEDVTNVGKHNITVKFNTYYSGKRVLEFEISPNLISISKITANGNSFVAEWQAVGDKVTGYQIQYSKTLSFTSYGLKTVSGGDTASVTVKNLNFDSTYYVRIRTYIIIEGKKSYSDWSVSKTAKIN